MEPRAAKILAKIKRPTGALEAEREYSLPLLSSFFLWRAKKAGDQSWLGNHYHIPGEILPFSYKELLSQYMCPGKEVTPRQQRRSIEAKTRHSCISDSKGEALGSNNITIVAARL